MSIEPETLNLSADYLDIGKFSGVKVDLRYATLNNFTGENLYGHRLKSAFLHKDGAEKFLQAIKRLQRSKPSWSFLVLDALRPLSVQKRMWSFVEGTPQQIYVANPSRGSIHNFGLAIDLTLLNEKGVEVDMGTPFDSFEELAQPRFEERFVESGLLTRAQVDHRHILRDVMLGAGFLSIPHEWWHFNAIEMHAARSQYKMIE